MGFIATIVGFAAKALKIDSGGGNIITSELYLSPGEDSKPLKSDYVFSDSAVRTGSSVSFAFYDEVNASKAGEGEKRIYARDKASGAVVAEIWLKNTGEIILKNDQAEISFSASGAIKGSNSAGGFELEAAGNFVANGVTMSPGGNISATSMTIGGVSFTLHVHGGVTTGAGVTGVPQ